MRSKKEGCRWRGKGLLLMLDTRSCVADASSKLDVSCYVCAWGNSPLTSDIDDLLLNTIGKITFDLTYKAYKDSNMKYYTPLFRKMKE